VEKVSAWRTGTDFCHVCCASVPVLNEISVNKLVMSGSVLGKTGEIPVLAIEVDGDVKRVNIPVRIQLEFCLHPKKQELGIQDPTTFE
jgi:hypothetical protein